MNVPNLGYPMRILIPSRDETQRRIDYIQLLSARGGKGLPAPACKRQAFTEEWEARVYLDEHPWPEPSPPLRIFRCITCRKWHITDKPTTIRKGRRGKKRQRR